MRRDSRAVIAPSGLTAKRRMILRVTLKPTSSVCWKRPKAVTIEQTQVRRAHIPNGDGRTTRPIGIPTFEDKVLQRAVVSLLEPLYEHDFLPCSFGFRPGRSPHQAIKSVWEGLSSMGGGWVIDLDIQAFFDTIDHQHLHEFLQQRVKDGVILRLIAKWLKAGVMEAGQ